jgi:hypothetical protein
VPPRRPGPRAGCARRACGTGRSGCSPRSSARCPGPPGLPDRLPGRDAAQDVALSHGQLRQVLPERVPGANGTENRPHPHRVGHQVPLGGQPQHGHELLACLFRGHERVDPRGQRFAEFGRAERPAVHQDDRSAARRRGVQLASTRVDQGQCGRTRVPWLPVGIGRWRQSSLQDEWHLVGDHGAHRPVERWTRAGRDQGQHRAAAARRRRGVLRRWRRGIEHAEHGCPGDSMRAAAHVQLVVDPALEVLHGERADPQ